MAGQTIAISVLADTKPFSKAMKSVGGITKGVVGAIGGIAAAVGGIALAGGISRALNIDTAQTKLKALGYDAQEMSGIMDSALESVKGTSYGLGDAATLASQALAAGIPQGQKLTESLKLVTNTAALAGVGLGDMGSIFSKVWTAGRVGTQELNQLADRGIPIWTTLAESLGVGVDELRKMVSAGQVSAEMFEGALGPAVEGIAGTMGTSFKGLAANVMAALGRVGAIFAGPLIENAKPWMEFIIAGLDKIGGMLAPLGEKFGNFLAGIKPPNLKDFSLEGIVQGILGARDRIVDAALNALGGLLDAAGTIVPLVVQGTADLIRKIAEFLQANAPIILGAAVGMLTGLIAAVAQIVPPLIAELVGVLPSLVGALLGMLPAILDAAVQLLSAIVEAVPVIVPPLVAALVEMVPAVVGAIVDAIPAVIDGAVALFTGIVEALPIVLPAILSGLIALIPKVVTTLIGALPKILDGAVKLFTGIVTAIPKILPKLIPAVLKLIPEIVKALIGAIPQLVRAGMDLIGGLIQGIGRMAASVGKALIDIAKNAIGGFLSFLGIHSPSRLFAGYGANLVEGLVRGIGHEKGALRDAMGELADMASVSFTPTATLTAPRVSSDARAQARAEAQRRQAYANPAIVELGPVSLASLREALKMDLKIGGGELTSAVNGGNALVNSLGAY